MRKPAFFIRICEDIDCAAAPHVLAVIVREYAPIYREVADGTIVIDCTASLLVVVWVIHPIVREGTLANAQVTTEVSDSTAMRISSIANKSALGDGQNAQIIINSAAAPSAVG